MDVAKYLTQRLYGRKPVYTYFAGGSQGGHEAFDAAQRYPDDYEGVIAHYPAYNLQNMCDATFTIDTVKSTLRCPGGADTGDSCFSDAQIGAIEKIASPVQFSFAFAGGSATYPKWPILEGATFLSNHLGKTATADPNKPPFAADGTAFQYFPGKGDVTGFITRDLSYDPLAFDPSQWVSRIQQLSSWTDAVSTDLSRFTARGGKMILTHGTIDDSITPYNTIAYWQKLVAANDPQAVDQFARFYLIPGKGHGEGLFNAKADYLSALEAWVEQGQAPGRLIAVDGNTTAATNGRTRPLCLYGTYPKYTGPANPTQAQANDAANFTCAAY